MSAVAARAGSDRERGSITLLAAVLAFAVLVVAGLVVDGGARLDADRQVAGLAAEAARAGAEQVNLAALRASGDVQVDPGAAVDAARAYLSAAGYTGTVRVVGPATLVVTVSVHRRTLILALVGLTDYTVTRTATAALEHGVSGAGS